MAIFWSKKNIGGGGRFPRGRGWGGRGGQGGRLGLGTGGGNIEGRTLSNWGPWWLSFEVKENIFDLILGGTGIGGTWIGGVVIGGT